MVFIILHPIFFILAGSGKNIGSLLIPDFSLPFLALGICGFYIFLAVMIASNIYKRISYKTWQYIHVITYILIFGVLIHAVRWGSDTDDFAFIYILAGICLMVGITYRTQYKIRKMYSGKFIVKNVINETADTFTLIITPEKDFQFKAGQFCFLRLDKNHLHARHPFTISSAPGVKDISFTIKILGRFTKTAKELKAGDEVLIDGPFGKFIPKTEIETNEKPKDLIFIAGGVGITPFMSIIKDIKNKIKNSNNINSNNSDKEFYQNITLLYGSKTESDIIFKKEFDEINETWFKKIYILSNNTDKSNTNYENGYLSKEIIEKYVNNIDNSLYYICGPEPMKNSAKKILKELKVSNKNIFIEDFFW
jgi:predicted ferric reductase